MSISKIDKNFVVETNLNIPGIKFYNSKEKPFKIFGLIVEDGIFKRMPKNDAAKVSDDILNLYANTSGGRVRFKTNSSYVAISAEMGVMYKASHMANTGTVGFDLYEKLEGKDIFKGAFIPPMNDGNYESVVWLKANEEHEITINFPLYSNVKELYIGIDEKAEILPCSEYKIKKPIVFYGSSITQGACASRPGAAYHSLVQREFDCDILNLGFSGNARGEEYMAEYISNLDMSAFILDYDHNAPTAEHLKNTHEKFFKIIREKQKDLKILIMPRPVRKLNEDDKLRSEIVKSTYINAINSGDKNVAFLSGEDLIEEFIEEMYLVDLCHPNDAGFASMAKAVIKKLKEMGI